MHYTAMLAFRLPVPVLYHWPTVLLSLLSGIVASAIALFVVSRTETGMAGGFGRQRLSGRGHSGTALHCHGGDAAAGNVPLFPGNRRSLGVIRDRRFSAVLVADVSLSGPGHRPEAAQGRQRTVDGRGHLRHALHRHGRRQFHGLCQSPGPVPCRARHSPSALPVLSPSP